MATVYRSKIGVEIVALLVAGMLPALITTLADDKQDKTEVLLILIPIYLLIFGLMLSTRYKIDGNMLRIYVLVFPYKPIDISTITQIEETSNPLSAPATSLDRLGITHPKGYMLVSPKDKTGFIAALQNINPEIVFKSSK